MTQFLRNKNIGFSKNYSNPKEPLFYKSISNRGNKQNSMFKYMAIFPPFCGMLAGDQNPRQSVQSIAPTPIDGPGRNDCTPPVTVEDINPLAGCPCFIS
jgi:hypothetical protein